MQRKPGAATVQDAKLEDIQINPPGPPEPYALQYEAETLDEAAKQLGGDIKMTEEAIIIGIQPKFLVVYDGKGLNPSPRIGLKLPENVRPVPGVFMSPSAKDAQEQGKSFGMRQVNVDPKTLDWKLGGYTAYLKDKDKAPPKKDAEPANAPPPADTGAASPAAGAADKKSDPASATGGAKKPLEMLNLRSYIEDGAKLDAIIDAHKGAVQFYLVPQPKPGSGGKKGGGSTTGFAGEVEGKGPPPNAPPWPVSMDGPKMAPAGSDGSFFSKINWGANGNNTVAEQAFSAVGNYIHYRWELFDITEFAKKNEEKLAKQAAQTRAMIKAADERGIGVDTPGSAAAATANPAKQGDPGDAAKATGAMGAPAQGDATPADPNEKSYEDQIADLAKSKPGTGKNMDAETRNARFRRSFHELKDDTARAGADIVHPTGSTMWERQSNAQANLIAIELLPVEFVITSLGAGLRWFADLFSGETDNQEIHFDNEGTYLIRVITTPEVTTDKDGKEWRRPSSVATKVVQVVKMKDMVKEGLDTPGAQLAQAELDLANANRSGSEDRIKEATAARDLKKLEVEGDPVKYLEMKLQMKRDELVQVRKKWDGVAVGPIYEVQKEIDILENRLSVFRLQESRRTDGDTTLTPAQRVTATLISEVTGQTYPLMLSVGPMKMDGNRHRWKLLDATSEDSEGWTGYGDSPSLAVKDAFRQFGNKAQFGRGTIGVRVPKTVKLEDGIKEYPYSFEVPSLPLGWAIARGRIDDLVMTLAAIGLFVASAGTASIAIGAAVAAERLIERLYNGTLRFDAAAVSDVLAILGAVGAAAHAASEASVAAAGVKFQKIGDAMVMLEEGTSFSGKELKAAEEAFQKASGILSKIEKANEVLNYAGVVWGNVTFFEDMAETAELEAKGQITHAEARRKRAAGLANAINTNGMAIAPNAIKALQARKAAKAGKTGAPSETHAPTGDAAATPKPETTPGTPQAPIETTEHKAPAGGEEKAPAGGDHGSLDEEPKRMADEQTPKQGEGSQASPKPTDAVGAGQHAVGGVVGGEPGGMPAAKRAPKPGSARERAAAHKAFQEAVRTGGDLKAAAEAVIGKGGSWKGGLKEALGKLEGDHRTAAEQALVEARENIVNGEWDKIKGKYPGMTLENPGTKSFTSDIDATIRPQAEATAPGTKMAEQIEQAGKAARELADNLRNKVGGEIDAVIDTNVYSFIGEGRTASPDPKVQGVQQHVDLVTGLAEQLRGQGEAGFRTFERSLTQKVGDPRVAAEVKTMLNEARDFNKAMNEDWGKALKDAKRDHKGQSDAFQEARAREALLEQKKGELSKLMNGEHPDPREIARKQAEINWFAPDAYATPSAFKQAVAHGQRLKGTAKTAAEWKGSEVAAKLREQAAKLPPDDPRARKMQRDAGLAESQGSTLEAIEKDIKAAQENVPVDTARIKELQSYADGLRKSIAAAAEPFVIAQILGVTTGMPGPQRLSEAAAASGANLGMLESHVEHAADIDAKVKAAAKYSGRIAMAEWLGGLRPSADPIARLIGEFVQSRWGIFEDVSPGIMRDMFIRYAKATGRQAEIVNNARGEPAGASDSLKQAFVTDVMNWAHATNTDIQGAAMTSKAFDNPTPTTPAPPPTGEPSIKTSSGGEAAPATKAGEAEGQPAKGGGAAHGDAEGGQAKPGEQSTPGPDERPAPGEPKTVTGAAGVTKYSETPPLNPPGAHQPFEFRMKSLREGEAALQRIANGDVTALSERGVQLPAGYRTQGREFGLARMPDGTYAIIQGDYGQVRWSDLPKGTVPLAHTHPISPERALAKPGTIGELAKAVGKEDTRPGARVRDAVHVFPSAEDILFCAANKVVNHDVLTPYVHMGDGVLRTPTGAAGEIPVSFNVGDAKHIGNWEGAPIAEAALVAHDAQGNVLYISRIWAVDIGHGITRISFEPLVPTGPPDPTTLRPMHDTPSGKPGGGDTTGPGRPGGEGVAVDTGGGGTKAPGGPAAANAAAADATRSNTGLPELPGGVRISKDDFATTVSARRDPTALVRLEVDGQSFKLTDIYRRDLPPGTGAVLLAEALKAVKAAPGGELMIHGIINPESVAAHERGENPAESKLGKTATRALEAIGLTAKNMRWELSRGKLHIRMGID